MIPPSLEHLRQTHMRKVGVDAISKCLATSEETREEEE